MSNVKSILLVGVGGQGTILASKILSDGLMEAGYDVKMSEIHGMSQRGGNVSTQVRFGDKVFSPIIGKGEADLIVAFEKMEALRWIEYLKPGGRIVINDAEIPSVPIQMGVASYPEGIAEELAKKATTYVFKATDLAEELGNPKSMNMILLGALVKAIDLPQIDWEEIIKRNIKPAFVDINLKAFQVGQAQVSD
ncbi:MAG TPA: indolepyruvate oxidoreductase subunit beta [Bacillota bacterium]|jgi:indolepyruvate ferredoxin oxidoreductase beta subunit|nr:indolepyruvate oxidoreductase subunit beta [Clostridiales bacterium UBA9856]HOA42142.1 indolepyruvate oxidoreductase subunit beta [Bacillota bacterium]HPZ59436.1 indolepyruvate oxidoreductase subunit beta [Bacillota bacterium]HQC82439.1 indolepyruvate oxidoreductase subunit beta [Bacillota bacterium]